MLVKVFVAISDDSDIGKDNRQPWCVVGYKIAQGLA